MPFLDKFMLFKWNHYGHQHEHNYSFSPCFFQKNMCKLIIILSLMNLNQQQKARFGQHASSVVEHEMKKPDSVLMLVQFPSATGWIFLPVNFQSRLLWCWNSPHVQLHTFTTAYMLKIPNAGSHIPLFVHTQILHTLVDMSRALVLQLL